MKPIKKCLAAMLSVFLCVMSVGAVSINAQTVLDEPVLLSEGKECGATAISSASFSAERAFDGGFTGEGDLKSRWYAGDGAKYPQSIWVDLGEVYNLSYVDSYWQNMTENGGGRVFGYKLYVSMDGVNYTQMADETDLEKYSNPGKGVKGNPRQRDMLSTAARYVKFEVTGCNQGNAASVWEIQVFGTDTALSFDGEGISATSEAEGYEAALAADGNSETAWKAADAGEQAWTIDLGGSFDLSEIGIDWLDETAEYTYKVEAGLDGEAFETVWEASGGNETQSVEAFARFVRITISDSSDPNAVGIREVTLRSKMNKLAADIDLGDPETGMDPVNELILNFTNALAPDADLSSSVKIKDLTDGVEPEYELVEITPGKSYRIDTALEYGKSYQIILIELKDVFGQSLTQEINFRTLIKKELSEITFYNNDEKLEALTSGTVCAKLTAKNNQGEAFSPCLIVLVFNQDGSLSDIAAQEAALSEGNGAELEASVTVDDADTQYVEAYIWDGINRMSELSAPVLLKK